MVEYIENFIEPGDKFSRLWEELSWIKHNDAPRMEYWYTSLGQPYTYGRGAGIRTYDPQPMHEVIEIVTDALEARLGFRYEGCFSNAYETGSNWLGWHSDDDMGIDHEYPLAVVSLYSSDEGFKLHPFGLRTIQTKWSRKDVETETSSTEVQSFLLGDGSLFLMGAGMQFTHMHRIPKAGYAARSRISLTYRKLKNKCDS